MKRIALAIERFSRHAGGAESYAVALACRLVDRGWEVHLFGETWDGEPRAAHFHPMAVPGWLPSWARMLGFALCHRRMVAAERFDVVLGFGNTIVMNVYQSHGGVHRLTAERKVYADPGRLRQTLKRALMAISIKHRVRHWIESAPFRLSPRPRIVAISRMIRDDMIATYDVSASEIDVIYNGVDLHRFDPALRRRLREPLRRELGLTESDSLFLFVSFDLRKKGMLPLIDAADRLAAKGIDTCKVVVVGGLPSRRIRQRIAAAGLVDRIVFTGPVRSTDAYYAGADAFVLPTYYDACSLVVFEAMAFGLPCITTDANGAAGIITSGRDGFVIPHPPDAGILAERMAQLTHPERRTAMGREARNAVGAYSIERNHEQLLALFEAAAAGENPP